VERGAFIALNDQYWSTFSGSATKVAYFRCLKNGAIFKLRFFSSANLNTIFVCCEQELKNTADVANITKEKSASECIQYQIQTRLTCIMHVECELSKTSPF